MPPIVAALLWKLLVPVVIKILEKTGYLNTAEALATKAAARVVQAVESVETYHTDADFPKGKNGQ